MKYVPDNPSPKGQYPEINNINLKILYNTDNQIWVYDRPLKS